MVKQNFLTKMLLLFALVVGSVTSVWAEDFTETITLSEQNYSNAQEVASTAGEVVTLTFDKGTSSTTPAYYDTGKGVRVYAGGSMVVTANDNVITKVVVTFNKNNNPTISMTSDGTTTSAGTNSPATWEGSATQVFFNVTNAGHARIQKVEVTYTVSAIPTHTVTFSMNGVTTTDDVKEGAAIKFPEVEAPEGYTFLGWTTAEISGEQASAPSDLLTEATMGTADITYYAVFAIASGSGPSDTYALVTEVNDLSDGDKIILVSTGSYTASKVEYDFTVANGAVNSSSLMDPVNVEIVDNKVTSTAVAPITLVSVTDGWKLQMGNNYLNINPTKNGIVLDSEGAVNTISITDNIASVGGIADGNDIRYIWYNPNSGNGRFAYYKSKQKDIAIYKQESVSTYSSYCTLVSTTVPVTISTYKWATFSSDKALDFTNSDVKAYIVTGFEGTAITKQQVYVVPSNTGLLLNAEAGTYGIPVATDATEDVSANKLNAVLGQNQNVSAATEPDVNYVLSVKSGKVVFAWIGSTQATVKAGQAYLTLENGPKPGSGNAPWLSIEGDDETTGIQNIERTMNDNQYYTLDGRRVAQPTKGLYIVNGKKVLVP